MQTRHIARNIDATPTSSCAHGESLLALLGGKVSSRAANAVRSMDWNAHQGTVLQCERRGPRADADARASALKRRAPGRHHWLLDVAVGGPLAARARVITVLDVRTSRFQATRTYARTVSLRARAGVRQPRRLRRLGWGTRASRSHTSSSLPPAFGASPTAGTVFREASDRPAGAEGRVCSMRQPRPASVRCAHHRGTGWRGGA